jgi:hypothetical protein
MQIKRRCPRCHVRRYHRLENRRIECACGHSWRYRQPRGERPRAGEPKSPVDDGKPPAEPRYRKFGVVYVQVRRRCPRCGADRYHWIAHGVAQCECGHTWRFRMRDPLAVRDRTVKVIV